MQRQDPELGGTWGILGGAFDPVHLGHLTLAADILNAKKLDGVIVVPSFAPPHRDRPCEASFEDRAEMLRLAISNRHDLVLSLIERDLAGPSYTLTMVRALKDRYLNSEFRFLVGADNLTNFWNWHEPMQILSEIKVLAGARPGFQPNSVNRFPAGSVEYIPTRMLSISSSGIRELIRSGISQEQLAKLVPEAVAAYIISKRLYV